MRRGRFRVNAPHTASLRCPLRAQQRPHLTNEFSLVTSVWQQTKLNGRQAWQVVMRFYGYHPFTQH